MDKKVEALMEAANFLMDGKDRLAEQVIQTKYPFVPIYRNKRTYTLKEKGEQFFKDGFIDRYSGHRLIHPGMLHVFSAILPTTFPYHTNWKTDACHMACWEFYPTIDHIYPIALGGKNQPENWVSTSMLYNSMKSHFTLEQLGWTLYPKGDIQEWDGLSQSFIKLVEDKPSLLQIKSVKEWYRVTKKLMHVYLPT